MSAPYRPNTHSPAPSVLARLADELLRGGSELPVLPRMAEAALALASQPRIDPSAVIAAAGHDPPLAARILGVAGQAHLARTVPAASLRAAADTLGPHGLRDVLYMAAYSTAVFRVPGYQDHVAEVFRHSAVVARAARRLAERTGLDGDVAFLSGLLHDVGRARCLRIAARWEVPTESRGDLPPAPTEDILAATETLHTEAGAALARAWRLPDPVAEVCAWHHDPGDRPMARLVAAAEALAGVIDRTEHPLGPSPRVPPDEALWCALGAIGLDPFDADALLTGLGADPG